jgi:hypothetical protein
MKRTVLIIAAALVVVGLLGAGAWYVKPRGLHKLKQQEQASQVEGVTANQKGILKYFDPTTGEVDINAVEQMTSQVPSMLAGQAYDRADKKIAQAESAGEITVDQGNALRAALREGLL